MIGITNIFLYTAFFFLISFMCIHSEEPTLLCGGRWIEKQINIRHSSLFSLGKLCPAEVLMHNCRFHNIAENRYNKIISRRWVLDSNSTCISYSTHQMVNILHNRTLYLLGDSLMMQTFSSLVCDLYQLGKYELNIEWFHHRGGTIEVSNTIYNNVTCPFGAKHCHFENGSFHLQEKYNVKIVYHKISMYRKNDIQNIIISHNISKNDVILINFGLHYNIAEIFMKDLSILSRDINSMATNSTSLPKLLFMEPFPQHFYGSNTGNGYYASDNISISCSPISLNREDYRKRAYRSHIQILNENQNISVIYIHPALISQYDTHIDGDSRKVTFKMADCTHYCSESHIFDFIKMTILNHFIRGFN